MVKLEEYKVVVVVVVVVVVFIYLFFFFLIIIKKLLQPIKYYTNILFFVNILTKQYIIVQYE